MKESKGLVSDGESKRRRTSQRNAFTVLTFWFGVKIFLLKSRKNEIIMTEVSLVKFYEHSKTKWWEMCKEGEMFKVV